MIESLYLSAGSKRDNDNLRSFSNIFKIWNWNDCITVSYVVEEELSLKQLERIPSDLVVFYSIADKDIPKAQAL